MGFEWFFKYPRSMFLEGDVLFPGAYPWELRLALALILIAMVYGLLFRRMPERIAIGKRRLVFGLRLFSTLLLLLLILPPVIRTGREATSNRFVAFFVDDSRSMRIEDASDGGSRLATAKRLLFGSETATDMTGDSGIIQATAKKWGVRVFRFSETAHRIGVPEEWQAVGGHTDLYEAIKTVDERLRGVPLAAIVIVSDGAHTAYGDPLNAAQLMAVKQVPIFTLGLGDPNPPPNREIVSVAAPGIARRASHVNVVASVSTHGYTNPYNVRLLKDERVLGETRVVPVGSAEFRQVTIPLLADQAGTFTYTVDIPPEQDEQNVAGNRRQFRMETEEHRLPVLYLEGSPRTEYRFIRGALYRDTNFEIVSVLRTGRDASGRNRYVVQGAAKGTPEYEQLKNGLPEKMEYLTRFEAVILGDFESSLLTPEQHAMLETFIVQHGRGLLMLGGVNSFNAGGYGGTPVGNMLPVDLEAPSVPYDPRAFHVQATRDGVTHPIMRQVDDPVANANIWNSLSPLMGRNPVKQLKPGATALMEAVGTRDPVMAVHNYGAGRVGSFTTGGSWFWRMDRPSDDRLHERFWRQLILWLSAGAQPRISAQTDRDVYLPGDPVLLEVNVMNSALMPVNNATVTAIIETPFTVTEDMRLEWIVSREGVYQGGFVVRDPGEYIVDYRVEYANEGPDASVVMESRSRFTVQEHRAEFTRPWQDQTLLKALARKTGGAYFEADGAHKLVPAIEQHAASPIVAERWDLFTLHSLWDLPVVFILLFVLLLTEWLLRRRMGLP